MNRLPGKRPNPACDEHEPGQKLSAFRDRVGRQELPGLLGEVEQDRITVEDDLLAVDDGGNLAVGVDLAESRGVLVAAL